MKRFLQLVLLGALALGTVASKPVQADDHQNRQEAGFLRGEAYFLERIALPPGARLHVQLSKWLGGESVPVASTILPARNGATPFRLYLPSAAWRPALPYRLYVWIVDGDRVMMKNLTPPTVSSLSNPVRVRLSMAPRPNLPIGVMPTIGLLTGSVTKLDRRALSPNARVVITLSDVSLADAPAKEMYRVETALRGAQLPYSFRMSVRADLLKPQGRYALRAQVFENGRLTYTTDRFHGVTRENLTQKRELIVRPVR
jgi:putative lipoprotein